MPVVLGERPACTDSADTGVLGSQRPRSTQGFPPNRPATKVSSSSSSPCHPALRTLVLPASPTSHAAGREHAEGPQGAGRGPGPSSHRQPSGGQRTSGPALSANTSSGRAPRSGRGSTNPGPRPPPPPPHLRGGARPPPPQPSQRPRPVPPPSRRPEIVGRRRPAAASRGAEAALLKRAWVLQSPAGC